MNIGMLFVMILGGAAGLLSTFYIVVSLFAVIIYKFYRKVKYGKKMYDYENHDLINVSLEKRPRESNPGPSVFILQCLPGSRCLPRRLPGSCFFHTRPSENPAGLPEALSW